MRHSEIEWRLSHEPIAYAQAQACMQKHVAQMQAGTACELLWLLQHPPLYTAGISAKAKDLLRPRFAVYQTRRGGQYTYHGPGQRIIYAMLDLRARQMHVRHYVRSLQDWLIAALAEIGIEAFSRPGRVGLWVSDSADTKRENKIAAIGVRVQKYITSHGVAINVKPNLSHFDGINACGIKDKNLGITSLKALGINISMGKFDDILKTTFAAKFPEPQ